jgi:transposase
MLGVSVGVKVYLACGTTDLRKGMDGLAVLVQHVLHKDPFSGAVFAFRGKRGNMVKLLCWDTQGLCLYIKRLDDGRFVWPETKDGVAYLTASQLSMLMEGVDWRRVKRTAAPQLAG